MKAENENKVTTVESTLKSLHNNLRKVNYEKKCIEFKMKVLTKELDFISIDEIPINKAARNYLENHGIKTLKELIFHSMEIVSDLTDLDDSARYSILNAIRITKELLNLRYNR